MKWIFPCSLLFMFWTCILSAADECVDGTCALPTGLSSQFTVLSPVPGTSIEFITQGRRLETLNGKTIALVGGSFMANVTHPELKRLIQKEYNGTKIYLLNEIGSAGPYPRPGVTRKQKDEFQRKLKELHVDAVISGNGGCGLCTPKETGSCIAAEMLGIPSVMIVASGFVKQAQNTAFSAGVQTLRVVEYPGAFASHTHDELLDNTRKVLWPQIKRALTTQLEATEKLPAIVEGEVFSSTEEMQRAFNESGWTDGLPVMPPTPEAVKEFLAFTDWSADKSLGAIPPAQREVTVRHVAVNGVMAGCPPEYMPILLAFVQAMAAGDFRRPLVSTHAWTPYCWLNGPAARQLGFDCGQGEINGHPNMVLGRFINLAMLNLGGYKVKENRMGTFGYLMPWCLVENEPAALKIGWKPYHMQQGYQLNDSTITAASSINWGNNLVPATSDAVRIKNLMAYDAVEKSQMAVASGMPRVYRTFLLTESVARDLAMTYSTKKALENALVQTARIPVGQRAFANYWGNPGSTFNPDRYSLFQHEKHIFSNENGSLTPPPPWLEWTGLKSMETVPAMEAGKSAFIVTGDSSRNKELCVPGGGFATVRIELPKNWDALMAEKGYEPRASFRLESKLTPDTPPRRQHPPTLNGARGDLGK